MNDSKKPNADAEQAGEPPALGKWIGLGVGAGIGSAAVAAALLYASRARKKDSGR